MCLQYCHVTGKIFDNDFPCDHCPDNIRYAHTEDRCSMCRHYVPRFKDGVNCSICALTHQVLPVNRTCCHWNADIRPDGPLTITLADVEPDTMLKQGADTVATLFDYSDTAPEYEFIDENTIVVPLSSLSVPYVYGLSSWDWEEALGIKIFSLDIDDLIWQEIIDQQE